MVPYRAENYIAQRHPASLLEVVCISIVRESFINLLMPYRRDSDAKIQLQLVIGGIPVLSR